MAHLGTKSLVALGMQAYISKRKAITIQTKEHMKKRIFNDYQQKMLSVWYHTLQPQKVFRWELKWNGVITHFYGAAHALTI